MKEFSFEILLLVSQYLTVRDLKQFQLINKCCYEASIEALYSTVTLKNDQQIASFMHTISHSKSAGRYVKSISTSKYFNEREESGIWDKENFLDTIIEYCFNLREIHFKTTPSIIWVKLMFAASQGKLLNLQRLPLKYSTDIESYVYTALCFKKSLTFLNLWDITHCPKRNDYFHKKASLYLRDRITEFSNIQHLSIIRYINQPFSNLDTVIDDCPCLKELKVEVYPGDFNEPIIVNENVLASPPRPDIRKLTCSWENINEEDQLKYIMRKFPNLRYLIIHPNFFGNQKLYRGPMSDDIMMEFMVYLSAITKIELLLDTTREEFKKHWIKFIRLKKCMSKVRIACIVDRETIDMKLKYNKDLMDITYSISNMDTMLPHEDFLRENGSMIKSLTITGTFRTHANLDEISIIKKDILCSENWIYRTLQLCPSLNELTLSSLVEMKLSSNNEYQHTKLKKLSILGVEELTALNFLRNFSIRAPNLKFLHLSKHLKIEQRSCCLIEIDMPYTSLDLITIQFNGSTGALQEYHIKLNTIYKERYFVVDEDGTHELPCTIYHQSGKRFVFEITCLGLKQFKLKRLNESRQGGDFIRISEFE